MPAGSCYTALYTCFNNWLQSVQPVLATQPCTLASTTGYFPANTGTFHEVLRFHVQGRTYQFKALSFGVSTAPMELTVVAKELKLMAMHKGIRTHQYLDDCLVKATSHQDCLRHTQDLVKICQELGWLVNLENRNWSQAGL